MKHCPYIYMDDDEELSAYIVESFVLLLQERLNSDVSFSHQFVLLLQERLNSDFLFHKKRITSQGKIIRLRLIQSNIWVDSSIDDFPVINFQSQTTQGVKVLFG